MRILIAGGCGFLGGRLAMHFVGQGHHVLRGSQRDAPPDDPLGRTAPVVITPLNDLERLKKACAGADVVIKASGMNARECASDPAAAFAVNAGGTASLLDAAVASGVRRFLYVSTVHVYSDRLEGSISENTSPANRHPYATSNRAAENSVLAASTSGTLDGIVVRLSNGYGFPVDPRANCWMLLVNDLCRQVAETGRMVLASNGLQSRNFIPLSEVCLIADFLATRPLDEKIGAIGPINVGGKKSMTVLEMAQLIQSRCEAVFGFVPPLEVGPCVESDKVVEFDYRTDLLRTLGYVHRADPNEEIDDLLRYCRMQFGARR